MVDVAKLEALNDDQLAQLWHFVNDTREAMEKALKENPRYVSYGETGKQIEGILTKRLEERGVSSMATPHGTIHTVGRTTARIMDPEEFRMFVVTHHRWDMLDWKANMTACRDHLQNAKEPVPGVELTTYRYLRVTSPKATKRLEDVE